MALAEFSGTTLYGGRLRHPEYGLIHVLGYQNTAVNLADGPNAMLVHLPAKEMTQHNFVSVGRSSDVLTRMVDAVRPVPVAARGMDWMGWNDEPQVEVFEHDIYTVLLATDPTALPDALSRVEPRKRPQLDPRLLRFYADHYPEHAIAACCFDNTEAAQAKPLIMWYPPLDPDRLVLPALDCHTGEPPAPDSEVSVDHWVVLGTDEAPQDWGEPVEYGDDMRHGLRELLPDAVVGTYVGGTLPNGDFAIDHRDLLSGDLNRIRRAWPVGT
jgi:hypothetical protein